MLVLLENGKAMGASMFGGRIVSMNDLPCGKPAMDIFEELLVLFGGLLV